MALPIIAVVAAIGAAGYGVKKGVDAKDKIDKAEKIVKKFKRKFKDKKNELESQREELNYKFEEFAEYKLAIFTNEFKEFIKFFKNCKKAKSILNNEKLSMTPQEFKEIEAAVSNSLELSAGLAKGLTSGALTALGAYGSVGMLASASTGTAIASLSGAAATNATLAWLGGGSLAAGGFGIAGGMMVLGGIVTGPALAITGLMMDSKAEENLTKAKEFKYEVKKEIEKIDSAIEEITLIKESIYELDETIEKTLSRFKNVFNEIKSSKDGCNHEKIDTLIALAKGLKELLSLSILTKDGQRNKNLKAQIERIELS